ncbi:MAG: GntR family transcriptional regulator [Zoogloeaceae bacterium]|jgi:hypothetical protein|nr:GntR family transcriptional regulator [Zoogloeaceae bacterium]
MTKTISATDSGARYYTLRDALADSVRDRLFAHEFAPGALLDIAALTARYGVGRLSLTGALRQLAREHLLVARADGYSVSRLDVRDVECILDMLEHIRLSFLLRRDAWACGVSGARMCVSSSSSCAYWGVSGFAVSPPFVRAVQNLYDQLRLYAGPALSAIETWCAHAFREALAEDIADGESREARIERCCAKTARQFRQAVLLLRPGPADDPADGNPADGNSANDTSRAPQSACEDNGRQSANALVSRDWSCAWRIS